MIDEIPFTEEEYGKLKYKGVTLTRKEEVIFKKINEIIQFLNEKA